MKKLLFLLAFTAFGYTSKAQIGIDSAIYNGTDTISFRVTQNTADYAINAVQEPDIQVAISAAFLDVTDSNTTVRVVLTEAQVIGILKAITRIPEGIAAEPNKELLMILRPALAGRMWLAGEVMKVLGQNAAIYRAAVNLGKAKRLAIAAGIKRN